MMHRAKFLELIGWDLDQFKYHRRHSHLPFLGTSDDGQKWSDHTVVDAFLVLLMSAFVRQGMSWETAASYVTFLQFRRAVERSWPKMTASGAPRFLASFGSNDIQYNKYGEPDGWGIFSEFYAADEVPTSVKKAYGVTTIDATEVWRELKRKASLGEIDIDA